MLSAKSRFACKRQFIRLGFDRLEDRLAPAALVAVGAGPGSVGRVQVFDAATSALKYDLLPFGSGFRGGVNVAVGDVNGDGTPDVVASVAGGGAPRVRVFDGADGAALSGTLGNFLAYTPTFRGGVFVATGDVNGDGFADVITGAGAGASPRVKVFSGADGSLLANFVAFSAVFRGGVRVSSGDFRHLGTADIVVGAGPGASPRVKIIAGDTQAELANYLAFDAGFRSGVNVGTGDLDHDSTIDVIAGSGPGGKGRVRAFSGMSSTVLLDQTFAGSAYKGSARVDAVDANNDDFEDLLVGVGTGLAPRVRIMSGDGTLQLATFPTLGGEFTGDISVAGSVARGRGTNYQLAAPITNEIPVLERLARYIPPDTLHPKGQYVSVATGDIAAGKNVYFVAHGWAPGYRDWVNAELAKGHVLKWWETAGYGNLLIPIPNPGPDAIWMFDGYSVPLSGGAITISPEGGLAEQITKADKNAVVIAYSWIDDSATTAALNNSIPQQAYLSEALTNINGLRLATAIRQLLGNNYDGNIHLLGHSHGSKVVTLAALALQQWGGTTQAKQLTIFDSPESELTDEDNCSNFLWNYFQQLNPSKSPGTGIFIDNYFSQFGIEYSTMKIGDQKPLKDLMVDTQLFAFPYSSTDLGDWHAYPPAWYAQANAMPCTDGDTNGGLAWSPILGYNPTNLASEWEQGWSRFSLSNAEQACLEEPLFTITPGVTFHDVAIRDSSNNPVTDIQLTSNSSTFKGTYSKKTGWSGLAFNYTFNNADRGILRIQINDCLAYYVDSQYVPTGQTQQVTINIGWPATSQKITVTLLPVESGSNAKVTLNNFQQFDVSNL